jgi:hypothetical protein
MAEKKTFSDYYQIATKLKFEGRLDDALNNLEKALETDMLDNRPKGLCYADMADIYNQKGESQKELEALLKVKKYNPGILKDNYLEELKEQVELLGKENKKEFVEHFERLNDEGYVSLTEEEINKRKKIFKYLDQWKVFDVIIPGMLVASALGIWIKYGWSAVVITPILLMLTLALGLAIGRSMSSFIIGGFKNEERRWGTMISLSFIVLIFWVLFGFKFSQSISPDGDMEGLSSFLTGVNGLFWGVKVLLIFLLSFSVIQYNRAKRLRIETQNRIAVANGWYVVKGTEEEKFFASDISKTIFSDTLVSKGKDGGESIKIIEIGNVGVKSGS